MKNSILTYEIRALRIIFSRFLKNYFSLFVVLLGITFAAATIVLIPVIGLFFNSYLITYVETGKSNIISSFKKANITFDRFLSILITGSLVGVIKSVGYTLFYVPGLIFSYALAPSKYLITINDKIKTSEVIEYCFKYMKGQKLKLFLLTILNVIVPFLIALVLGGISLLIYFNTNSSFFLVLGVFIVIVYFVSFPLLQMASQLSRIMLFKDAFKGTELIKDESNIKTQKKEITLERI
jgi:hypothetical protein